MAPGVGDALAELIGFVVVASTGLHHGISLVDQSDNPVGSADRSYIASSMHSMRCCKLLDLPITSDRSKPILLQDQQILVSARHVIVKLEERAKYPDHLTPRLEHVPARAAQLCRE